MEPTSLIVAALVAGAAAAARDTASQAIKDAYSGLKSLVQKRFADKPEAEVALAQHEKKPEVWQEPLKDALAETGANQDDEIVQQAQQVLKLVNPQQASQGKYNVQIGEGKGIVIGDNAQVTQTFNDD
jgi:lipoprotein-anchoring transpeptidase ErfK/SrfK